MLLIIQDTVLPYFHQHPQGKFWTRISSVAVTSSDAYGSKTMVKNVTFYLSPFSSKSFDKEQHFAASQISALLLYLSRFDISLI